LVAWSPETTRQSRLDAVQKGFSPSPEQAKHTSSSTLLEIGPRSTKFHDEVEDEDAGFILVGGPQSFLDPLRLVASGD